MATNKTPLEIFGIDAGKKNTAEQSFYSLIAMYHVIEGEVTDCLRPFKLSPSQFNVLMIVKKQGGQDGISQADIASRLIVTASNMTRLLDRLEKQNLIERRPLKEDRRVKLIRITQKGSGLLDHVWPYYAKQVSAITGRLDGPERKQAADILIEWLNQSLNNPHKEA